MSALDFLAVGHIDGEDMEACAACVQLNVAHGIRGGRVERWGGCCLVLGSPAFHSG